MTIKPSRVSVRPRPTGRPIRGHRPRRPRGPGRRGRARRRRGGRGTRRRGRGQRWGSWVVQTKREPGRDAGATSREATGLGLWARRRGVAAAWRGRPGRTRAGLRRRHRS
ncbi:hypothetical protein FLP23_11455 [Protaetiibacter larvae]|uniref:Uncharacterized protein n=1 Tax=Protaetiibacter larvae TaxID=2592654 RepID=A0A5C1YCJ9_9MICO|nr:hypothetical protein FLP23_11455 [Protaetiibacter larvae]